MKSYALAMFPLRSAASAWSNRISVPFTTGTSAPRSMYLAWRKKGVFPSCPVWIAPLLVLIVSHGTRVSLKTFAQLVLNNENSRRTYVSWTRELFSRVELVEKTALYTKAVGTCA